MSEPNPHTVAAWQAIRTEVRRPYIAAMPDTPTISEPLNLRRIADRDTP